MQVTVKNTSGTPVAGATVTAVAVSDNEVHEALTDSEGVADLGALVEDAQYNVFAVSGTLTTQVQILTEVAPGSGDPTRYHGVTTADLFGLIDAGDVQSLEDAEDAVLALTATEATTPYGTVTVSFEEPTDRFFWVVPTSMAGADNLRFSLEGGLAAVFPSRTLTVNGQPYFVYRSGVSTGEKTFIITSP